MEGESSHPGEPIYLLSVLFFQSQNLDFELLLLIGIILVLLVFSGLMSGSEVAYFSLKASDFDKLEEEGSPSSIAIRNLLHKKRRHYLLSTILITNNLVNIGIITVSYLVISRLFEFDDVMIGNITITGKFFDVLLTVIVVPSFIVLFGENAPKIYAAQNNIKLAKLMSQPLLFLRALFWPFSYPMVKSGTYLEKRLRSKSSEVNYSDLNKAIEIASDDESENMVKDMNILKGVIHFGNINVKQIMKPRTDVVAVDKELNYKDLIETIRSSGYSRIPVFEEDIDHVVGVLYVKDLLASLDEPKDFNWQDLIREPFFTSETKKIDDLLREIQETRVHLVIVVDEYGGTSGIVTLEDIIEEVVGEIKDEFDDLFENFYRKEDENNYIFEGKMQINDAIKIIQAEPDIFDEVKGESDSLGGLILELAGRIPEKDDEILFEKYTFKVLSVQNHRIERIKLTLQDNE